MNTSTLQVKALRRDDRLSIIYTNKLFDPNFQYKTDIEKISECPLISKQSASANRVGFHLLVEEYEYEQIPIDAQDLLQWTPAGVFTKNHDVAMYLIQIHNAVLIDTPIC